MISELRPCPLVEATRNSHPMTTVPKHQIGHAMMDDPPKEPPERALKGVMKGYGGLVAPPYSKGNANLPRSCQQISGPNPLDDDLWGNNKTDKPTPKGLKSMLASSYPILNFFWTMLFFFVFILWIFLLIQVIVDVFRSRDLSGLSKALWLLFIIVLPFLGVLIYLIARGGKMHEHQAADAKNAQDAFSAAVRQAGGTSVADEIHKLSDLKSKGVLSDAEFDAAKAKLIN
jgi:hypothetical protein